MSAATSHPLPSIYTWGFTGAPIQIHLSLEVVTQLRKYILESETGSACGLLTGDTSKPGITSILDFKPLPTLDAASIEAAEGTAADEIVGFYRTTPMGAVSMPEEDRALAASFFRHPSSAFLLIEAGKATIGDARFCFWGEGELFDWPLMVFPFDAKELAAEEGRRRQTKGRDQASHATLAEVLSPSEQAQAALEPFPVPAAKAPTAAPKRQEQSAKRWQMPVLVALAAFLAFLGMFLYFRRGANPTVAAPPIAVGQAEVQEPLGLSVERRGNDLKITWNGHAEIMAKAEFGMLLIRGASVSRDVPLSAEELRAGTVLYSAPVDQTRFQLNVVAGGQVAREFLTVVMPQVSDSVPSRGIVPSSPGNGARTNAESRQAGSSERVAPRELRQFKPLESPNLEASAPRRLDEPPPIGGTAPVNAGTPALLNQPALSPIAPPVSQTQAPAASAPATEVSGARNSPIQAARSGEAQPPLPTHQVVPPLPPLLRGVLWKLTTVDVNVSVDAAGNVTKAEAVAKPGLHPLLRDAAVQAARRWKFQPAQFNGHAVPANMVLQFNFAPTR